MAMTLSERLKLARDDYDQQEKLYNSLVLGQRFYIGIAAIAAGASVSLADIETLRRGTWASWLVLTSAAIFWACLLLVMYHLFRMVLGEPWSMPRSIDHYFAWKAERLNQIGCGTYETGTKTPDEFAEDEMICQMADAYAIATNINREGNLSRQRRLQWVGKFLLGSVVAVGLQGGSKLVYSMSDVAEQHPKTCTAATATAGANRYD